MKYYTVEQAIAAEYTLTPIQCGYCKHIGEITYNHAVNDYYCEWCGRWHDELSIVR